MDRMKKRTLCLLLAACMLLGLLAGCGKKNNAQQLSATVYVPQYLDLNLDLEYVRGGCCDGENLYVIGQIGHDATETDPDTGETYTSRTYTYDIFRISLADGASEKLSGYTAPAVPEGREGRASIERLETGKDGTLWVTEYLYLWGNRDQEKYPDIAVDAIGGIAIDSEVSVMARSAAEAEPLPGPGYTEVEATPDTPAGEVYEDQEIITRRQLDAQGNELDRIDISNLDEALAGVLGEDEYINNHTFDSEGNLYVVTASKIYALDPQMNILFSVEGKDMWSEPIQGGGLMGMQVWEDDETSETSTNKLRTIDPAKQDWGPEYILSSNVYDLSPGGGDYLCYYQLNDSIFGFKAAADDSAAGEGERLLSWIEADIDYSDVNGFYFLPDGRVAALLMEWPEDGKGSSAKISVVILTATPREELPEKTTLIYASLYLSYDARRKILDFNKRSDQYRIEVRDYAEYDTDGKGQMALQKLNTEILAGNVPDILDTNNLPLRQYGAKGILEDLWPFIDSDPDLGRDALMVRPLEANAQDGKLYEIFNSFSIQTAAGPSKIVGDSLSWTLADLQAALEKMPEGCSIMGLNMDQFVDWTTGKCSFDSEDFKAMLEFCRSFPVEWDWEKQGEDYEDANSRIMNGRQLLSTMNVSDFTWSVQSPAAVFNNEFTFVGFPRENGSAGSYFSFYRGLAMTSSCADKEGAWSFIRQTLLPQVENGRYYGNFPINKADFDKVVQQSMEIEYETDENGKPVLDEDGNKIPVYMGDIWVTNDLQVPSRAATQEDVDKVMELYNAVDSMYAYDEKIFDAVKEVASQYFAGDKPLDDTASLIQSKVSLYVNESR